MNNRVKCCLSAALALLCAGMSSAQNRSVEFAPDTDTMDQMFAKAAAKGRTVFIDCYTSWCGPCRMMARDVFTTDRVADFMNGNFYCAKYDMEKGEGPAIAEKYKVKAYPTFLFINPETGALVNILSGAHPADDFIAAVKDAMNPDRSIEKIKNAYESGNRDPEAVNDYLTVLANAHDKDGAKAVALDFLKGMTKEELAEMENWTIFMRCPMSLFDEPVQTVFQNRAFFNGAIGEKEISGKTEGILYSYVRPFVVSLNPGPDENWDQKAFEEARAVIAKCGDPAAPGILLHLKAAEANQNGKYAKVLKYLNKDLKKNIVKGTNKRFFQVANISRLGNLDSKSLRRKAEKYFEKALAAVESDQEKAGLERMIDDVRAKWSTAE